MSKQVVDITTDAGITRLFTLFFVPIKKRSPLVRAAPLAARELTIVFYYTSPINILPCGLFPNLYKNKNQVCAESLALDLHVETIFNGQNHQNLELGWVETQHAPTERTVSSLLRMRYSSALPVKCHT